MDTPIFDCFDLNYKSPFGAIRQYQPSTFSLRFPKEWHVSDPTLVMFRPGEKERFIPLDITDTTTECNVFTCNFNPLHKGLHHYYFFLMIDGNRRYVKRSGARLGVLDNGDLFQLTVFDKDMAAPDWIKGGIMYQIFPDRFCRSGEKHENVPTDRIIHENWEDTPFFRPDDRGIIRNNDYFAGDFKGIESKLPYLQSLGVTCIYLNPVFESHENHRYSTACYEHIDPMLGTDEDFEHLCKQAKTYGIDIILDGVFSHTGADSIYFNKFGRYPTPGAYQSEKSPYYSWYHFWGNKEYESWWGIDTLPNVDENNPSYTKYICGDDGVLDYWLSLGAAGYRLDVADELPDEFLDNLRACVKKFDEEKIVIGEVWEDASNKEAYGVKRRYLLGDQLDSVMNYPFREAIIAYMKGEAATTFRDRIMGILENYPKCTVDVLMNFVSTHDIERAINRFGGQPCDDKSKDWMASNELSPEEYERGKTLLKGAMVLQFFLPGVPSIYYGDEAGLQGWKDPFNRRCYPWGQEDTELIDYTRQLAKIRREHPAFAEGAMEFLVLEDNVVGFARYIPENGSSAVILLNRGGDTTMVSLRDKAFGRYAFSTVISGICDGDAVILPKNSYAVISAVRTNVPNAR